MMDFATWFTIWLLYLVEYSNWNSQLTIGYGCGTSNLGTENMGYTDTMPYHTGTTKSSRTSAGLGIQYRYIEGLWDNVYDFIDGCYNNKSSGFMLILNPLNFSDSVNGTSVGIPASGYPTAFSVKAVNNTFPLFIPSSTLGGAGGSSYSCDRWQFAASNPCNYVGGYYMGSSSHGLFCLTPTSVDNKANSMGSRPMKLP